MLDNISPNVWGPALWQTSYLITYAYPVNPTQEDKTAMINWFGQYKKILPCERCRYNFTNHLAKYPLDDKALANKYTLMQWLVNMNNEVNKMTGKPSITLNDAYEKYIVSGGSNINVKHVVTIVLIFFIICALVVYLLLKRGAKLGEKV